jgi:hypothetical protein
MKNPLREPLDRLFEQLLILNGIISFLNNQLEVYAKLYRRSLSEAGFDVSAVQAGAALLISDLTDSPRESGRIYHWAGALTAEGEEYFQAAERLFQRHALSAVAQAYEAHETFLLDSVAYLIHAFPGAIEPKKLAATKREFDIESLEDLKGLVRILFRKRQNRDLLGFLRSVAPQFVKGELHNACATNLQTWYSVATIVRNTATHSGGRLSSSEKARMRSDERALLRDWFPSEILEGEEFFAFSRQDAQRILTMFGEHGYLVFKALSESFGLDWRIFTQQALKNDG